PVTAEDFDDERVPAHLRMNFRAVDERGRIAGSAHALADLRTALADRSRASVARSIGRTPGSHPDARDGGSTKRAADTVASASARPIIEQDGLTDWSFGELPDVIDTRVAGGVVRGYPALVDAGKTVSVRVEATAEAARAATRDGV